PSRAAAGEPGHRTPVHRQSVVGRELRAALLHAPHDRGADRPTPRDAARLMSDRAAPAAPASARRVTARGSTRWAFLLWLSAIAITPAAAQPDTVFLEDLTWTELRAAVQAGQATRLAPTCA